MSELFVNVACVLLLHICELCVSLHSDDDGVWGKPAFQSLAGFLAQGFFGCVPGPLQG